ncbi:MAG: phosphate acyltransferase PlsX [Neisseriaceae bacterium]
MAIVLSVDVMSGDHGINITIPACIKFLHSNENVKLIIVGDKEAIYNKIGSELSEISDRFEVIHTSQVVEMDEAPQSAMRNKKDSSMRVAINQVKEGKADAIVSAGNTGALMATARYVLRTMDGIDRPAIAKILPTITGEVCVLDLGANVECYPENLLQFGVMGSLLMQGITKKSSPSIGLLNIGSEEIKGHENIKKAAELFKKSSLNFYGNVEGDDISKGIVDVVVCDGFTGNVALKTIEGTAKMIGFFIKQEFNSNFFSKIMGIAAYPVINRVKTKLDIRKYNGAILIGLNGLVMKSHGGTDELGFFYALQQTYNEVDAGVITLLRTYLKDHKHVLDQEEHSQLIEFQDLSML